MRFTKLSILCSYLSVVSGGASMNTSVNCENSAKGRFVPISNVCSKKVPVTYAANAPTMADAFRVDM